MGDLPDRFAVGEVGRADTQGNQEVVFHPLLTGALPGRLPQRVGDLPLGDRPLWGDRQR